jgi:diketogulonate reductase-like aldo/keto reductase
MTASPPSPEVRFADGEAWPALGLGTWRLGEARARRRAEVASIRLAIEIGYRVFDTAEMYGEGGAEEVVGEALAGALASGVAREQLRIVTKVYPHHAGRAQMLAACGRSLRRLRLEQIDLYLLHWRGAVPLAETLAGFAELLRRGWIRRWGVSNFDLDAMQELVALPGGEACAANQVYYSLGARGVEFDLLPWMRERRIALMAYCPVDQGALAGKRAPRALRDVAARHGAGPAQVALAALLAPGGVIAIPKAVQADHLRENWAARTLALDNADRRALDLAFPPPRRKLPLAMS